ncbi:MAG: hypothetical protein RI988_708 [Pseudomonadota bacterium]
MIIKFDAIGMSWEADVDYQPAGTVRMFESLEPPDDEEIDIVSLWNEHATNAVWLLKSEVGADIEDAAIEAARKAHQAGRSMFNEP